MRTAYRSIGIAFALAIGIATFVGCGSSDVPSTDDTDTESLIQSSSFGGGGGVRSTSEHYGMQHSVTSSFGKRRSISSSYTIKDTAQERNDGP